MSYCAYLDNILIFVVKHSFKGNREIVKSYIVSSHGMGCVF